MSVAPILTYVPKIDPEAPPWLRQNLTLLFQKLNNHTQAFTLQQQDINNLKAGGTTTVIEGGSGSGPIPPPAAGGIPVNDQSGVTSYATMAGDNGTLILFSAASPIAVSLTSQSPPWGCYIANLGALSAGTVTLTPAGGTISYAGNPGAATMPILPTYSAIVAFDGTNWWAFTEPIAPVTTAGVGHEWLASYDGATGAFTQTQPAFSDISGMAAPAQLPLATATTFGIVEPDNVTITIAAGVITSVGGGGSPNFADNETPSGTINGTNVTFTLAHSPSPAGSLILGLAGLTQWQNASGDYTLSANTITFALAPTLGPLIAWYRY